MTGTVWIDGAIMDAAEAKVSVFDDGLTVGDGVFETIKVIGGRPFGVRRHIERLHRSARGSGWTCRSAAPGCGLRSTSS